MNRRHAVMLLALGQVACSRGNQAESELKLTSDEKLEAAITKLWLDGGSLRLADVVDVAFDELLVFPETALAERINAAAGQNLLRDKYYLSSTQLFLYRQAGRAVRATMVASDVFEHSVQNARFGANVSLVAPGQKKVMSLRD